jgi:hypothetical protein
MGHNSSMREGESPEIVASATSASVSEPARDGWADGRVRVSSPGWEEAVSTLLTIHLWMGQDP